MGCYKTFCTLCYWISSNNDNSPSTTIINLNFYKKMKKCIKNFSLLVLLIGGITVLSCSKDDTVTPTTPTTTELITKRNEQTTDYIAVYGTSNVTQESYDRVYTDIKFVMDRMDNDIKQGMLNANAKMLVVQNEEELTANITYFMTFIPTESVYTNIDGTDESLATSTDVGLSNTKLELMYLCVYYSLLTESSLSTKYNELIAAYNEAANAGIFTPGEAYIDGFVDDIHQNASDNNALKYGSYLFNMYKVYFGNQNGQPGEYTITTMAQMQTQNPLGYSFMNSYFDL